ncbi:MAG: hypothetical protein Q4G19_01740 [Clostridia bacterium]|nr:hypothetical protein [Clostridia bacterium]
MQAANQFKRNGTMTAETCAAELDRIIVSGVSGVNDKNVRIADYDE